MTPAQLKRLGRKTFGDDWKAKLAPLVPLTIRSIDRYLAQERQIGPIVAARITQVCTEAAP